MNTCKFCHKFSYAPDFTIEKADTILYETQNFVVTPTLGSLVEGWLLIISKQHFLSCGQLGHEYFQELRDLINIVRQQLQNSDKEIFVFEHGSFSPLQSTGCGIDHLHFHIVPINFNLFAKAKEYSSFLWNSANLFSTKQYYSNGLPYLYIECPSGEKYITTDARIPSQFFRRIIAKELAIEDFFDWKQNYGIGNIDKTIDVFKSSLELV